ncbi:hypothetical protein FB446DRAFT_316419 [Lentinula raphanica]|nr:hypothetical protein FB446DRAFT_316419 [Lentinula raphanica]
MRSKFMNLFLGLSLLMVSTWAILVGQPVQASAGHVTDANTSESKSTSSEKLYKPVQGSAGHVTDAMRPSESTEKLYFSSKREWTARDIECVKIGVHLLQSREKGRIGAFQRSSNSWSWAIPTYDKTRLSDWQTVLFIPTKMRRIPIALVLSMYWGPTVNLPKSFSRCCPVKCSSLALAFGMFKIV